jgi:hypothetical protein
MEKIKPPFADQTFDSFQQWVNHAKSYLTCHVEYNNTQHPTKYGDKGYRGPHFTAMCFDSLGRRVRQGSDFQRAHDEGAFPIWWIWPDQIVDLVGKTAEAAVAA